MLLFFVKFEIHSFQPSKYMLLRPEMVEKNPEFIPAFSANQLYMLIPRSV